MLFSPVVNVRCTQECVARLPAINSLVFRKTSVIDNVATSGVVATKLRGR